MARLKDAILNNQGWTRGTNAPTLDLKYGGQMGYAPQYAEWVNNAAGVRKNIIALVLDYPRGFDWLPEPLEWINTLRALIELHPLSITGLNATLTVATTTNPVGGDGQQQLDPTNVTMEPTNVSMRWNDKYGFPITKFWSQFIRLLIMDPQTKVAGISTLGVSKPGDMLPDMRSFSCAFIEPDPQHNKVVRSWVVTNLFPQGSGEVIGTRDMTADGEVPSVDIQFGGIAQYGFGVDVFCQQLLDGIDITGANPLNRPSFIQGIDADVNAAPQGYQYGAEQLGAEAYRV